MLRIVRLEGLEKRKPGQLSGGQQQRVALARALVNRPAALLLDEPLGALDVKLRKQMQLELKRIQSELGTTFVYVTHDQEEALAMSDRIAVMNEGVVEQIAPPRELYERPLTVVLRRLHRLAERARVPGRRRRRPAARLARLRRPSAWSSRRTTGTGPATSSSSRSGPSGSASTPPGGPRRRTAPGSRASSPRSSTSAR